MPFTPDTWKTAFTARLPHWRQRMQQLGITSLYASVSAMALWPVAAAAQTGDWQALTALGAVLAGVGGNLLANRLQSWQDEADAARQLSTALPADPALGTELEAVLHHLDALAQARQALPPEQHAWFDATLQQELAQQGRAASFSAQVHGSGAVAQGPGAVAAGERGVAIGGEAHGNTIITAHGASEVAQALATASPEGQRKRQLLRHLWLQELNASQGKSLKMVMDEIGARAEVRGLTPEILEELLRDE